MTMTFREAREEYAARLAACKYGKWRSEVTPSEARAAWAERLAGRPLTPYESAEAVRLNELVCGPVVVGFVVGLKPPPAAGAGGT